MNEIDLLRSNRSASLLATREEKQHKRALEAIVFQARENALKGDAAAALVSRAMEQTVDLYKYGQTLAGDDPLLAGVMNRFVAGYVASAERRQHDFDGFRL
ncbi:hypothetical protein [Curtobacterium sp. MCBD17_019]|uniref:hypothetical protein n=1 Tax=Curtobacterium sp. MCBD17_019 TaxID=2175669 RepID=UPI000DA8B369|nr:hypothetical protein [Curtobacterium sp. MCBD17_019]PZE75335.1 hypothetical protein DEI82_08310 [Curtobacterium sp. MCBD17_019]